MELQGFFPNEPTFKDPKEIDLSNLTLLTQRFDLSVYHLAYGTKPLRKCTIRRMIKRQNRINSKKSQKIITLSPQERRKKCEKSKWLGKLLEKAKSENLQFSEVLPNGKIQTKTKIIARMTTITSRKRRQTNQRRRMIMLNGPFRQAISHPQSELGKFGTASKVVRIKNSPFSKTIFPEAPQQAVLKSKKAPIKGYGDDSQFPTLLR